ncbi:hypothetical protein Shyhy01_04750 [Streptomyces hygroscopicus subsp. hygroscopicus]|nr:hypothetical protein Shyhy01_04750 [Streptomyces hygroscopicus subsp. hygroscopicus]
MWPRAASPVAVFHTRVAVPLRISRGSKAPHSKAKVTTCIVYAASRVLVIRDRGPSGTAAGGALTFWGAAPPM